MKAFQPMNVDVNTINSPTGLDAYLIFIKDILSLRWAKLRTDINPTALVIPEQKYF